MFGWQKEKLKKQRKERNGGSGKRIPFFKRDSFSLDINNVTDIVSKLYATIFSKVTNQEGCVLEQIRNQTVIQAMSGWTSLKPGAINDRFQGKPSHDC